MPAAKRGAGSTGPLEAPPQRRFVMVQVDEEQRQSLDAAARLAGVPLSTWVRMVALQAARKGA